MVGNNQSIYQVLEGIDFFKGFTRQELDELLAAGVWAKAPPEKIIITEGEQDLHMYVLVEGRVNVVLNEKVLSSLNAGDTFGEFGLMGAKRTAHVVADTECLLLGFNAFRLNLLPLELQIKFLKKLLFTVFSRLQKVNRVIWWDLPKQWR